MNRGFTGISFPFRLNNKGGLKMSSTSYTDSSHIKESIIQILSTEVGERIMEVNFGSSVSASIFEPGDLSSISLIKYEIENILKELEPRIEVTNINLSSPTTEHSQVEVEIEYIIIQHSTMEKVSVNI